MHTPPMMDYTFFRPSFGSTSASCPDYILEFYPEVLPTAVNHHQETIVRHVSSLDWERNRPIITQLYHVHPLKILRKKMESMGFYATEQMYKKRFSLWNLRKNYTRAQKDQVVEQLSLSDPQARLEASSIVVNSQPLKYHRIIRYHRQQRPRAGRLQRRRQTIIRPETDSRGAWADAMSPAPSSNNPDDAASNQALVNYPGSILEPPPIFLVQPTDNVNNLVLNVDSYLAFHFSWDKTKQPYGFCKELADVFNIASAARLAQLKRDVAKRTTLVKEATSNVGALIQRQPLQLIEEIIRRFSNPGWASTPDIRRTVLKQIARETSRRFNHENPLVVITYLLQDPSTMASAASAILKIMFAAAARKLERGSEDIFGIQQDIADSFINIGDYDDARTICQSSLAQAKDIYPDTHRTLRNINRDLGLVLFKQGHWKKAERLWREVCENTAKDTGAPNIGATGILTCERLGSIYKMKGWEGEDLKLSADYYRLALEGGLRAWGIGTDVVEYFNSLAQVLADDGKVEQLMDLCSEYAFLSDDRLGREFEVSKL